MSGPHVGDDISLRGFDEWACRSLAKDQVVIGTPTVRVDGIFRETQHGLDL
jgi:hypothetical protein